VDIIHREYLPTGHVGEQLPESAGHVGKLHRTQQRCCVNFFSALASALPSTSAPLSASRHFALQDELPAGRVLDAWQLP